LAASPYVVSCDATVASGVTLTIEAGMVTKFGYESYWKNKRRLLVNGTLDLQGTLAEPVVYTSARDDDYGGDTNGDGTATSGAVGDWGYIKFTGSSVGNVFEYAVVRYGGYRDGYPGPTGTWWRNYMIWIDGTGVTVQHALLEHSYADGSYIYHARDDPKVTVQYCTFRLNSGAGVRVEGS
jgi:hypothetical protein